MRFDWSSLLLSASLVNLIITSALTLFAGKFRGNNRARAWFLILNACIAIILVESIIRNSQLFDSLPYLLFMSTPILFVVQPALHLYQRALIGKRDMYWPHLILPALNFIIMIPTFMMNSEDKLAMFHQEDIQDPLWIVLFYLAYFTFYQFLIFRDHKRQSIALENEYSKNTLEWQKLSSKVVAFSGLALFSVPVILAVQYFQLSPETDIMIRKASTVIFSLISHVLLFSLILSTEDKKTPQAAQKKEVPHENLNSQREALLSFISSHQPYLDNDLTLNSLAEQIGWSRSELSAVINRGLELNFYDFINSLRMEALSKRISNQDDETYTLDHLVEACGFTNYVSFYRYVKRTRGITPSALVKQIKQRK